MNKRSSAIFSTIYFSLQLLYIVIICNDCAERVEWLPTHAEHLSGRKTNGKNHDYDKSFAHLLYNDRTEFYTLTNLANHY